MDLKKLSFLLFFCIFASIVIFNFYDPQITSYYSIVFIPNSEPILNLTIPNQTLLENYINFESFDLDDYFFDPNGDGLSYAVHYINNSDKDRHINVTINETTNKVIFSIAKYIMFPNYRYSRWYGTEKIRFSATDESLEKIQGNIVTLSVLPDLDGDDVLDKIDNDDDSDGLNDTLDYLLGNESYVYNTNLYPFFISVDESILLNKSFFGIHNVKLKEGNRTVVEFDYNFSEKTLCLPDISVYKQVYNTTGLVIAVLNLTEMQTKTFFIEKLNPSSNTVCIRDIENFSINDFNFSCDDENVILVICDGNVYGNYKCIIENEEMKVEGLQHSIVKEHSLPIVTPPVVIEGGLPQIGGRVIKKIKLIAFSTKLIHVKLKPGKSTEYFLRVTNEGKKPANLTLRLEPQIDFISMDKNLIIPKGETKIVRLNFVLNNTIKPGSYISHLFADWNDFEKEIMVLVEVKPLKPLLDVEVSILPEYKTISFGESLLAGITIHNLGEAKKIDVGLEYSIEDLEGNTIITGYDTLAVETRMDIIKRMQLPKRLKSGTYLFVAKTYYNSYVATSSEMFTYTLISKKAIIIVLIASFIVLLFVLIALSIYIMQLRKMVRIDARLQEYSELILGMMKVKKRDKRIQNFDSIKLKNSMVKTGVNLKLAEKITKSIVALVKKIKKGNSIDADTINEKVLKILQKKHKKAYTEFKLNADKKRNKASKRSKL